MVVVVAAAAVVVLVYKIVFPSTTVGTAVGTSPDATVGTLDGGAVSVAVAVLLLTVFMCVCFVVDLLMY